MTPRSRLAKPAPGSSPKRNAVLILGVIAASVLLGSFLFIRPTVLSGDFLRIHFDESESRLWGITRMAMLNAQQQHTNDEEADDMLLKSDFGNRVFCDKETVLLKIFMYNLPRQFHFGMIAEAEHDQIWPRNMSQIPRYPGGLNLQHSAEYWLTLDLLSSALVKRDYPCTAMLVDSPEDADVFFVPFFSSLSYNKYTRSESAGGKDKNVELQEKLVHMLQQQVPWRRYGGKNHVLVMHHPNSLHVTREKLKNAMFIVADFGRYSIKVANIDKDVVGPYKHMLPSYKADNSTFDSRTIFLFFKGVIVRKQGGVIRQQLYELLKNEPGVHFVTGTARGDGVKTASEGMRASKFCLHLAGDTPSSNRLFDAIASHCVPVIISDDIELPFEDELDYTAFSIFVKSTDSLQTGFLMELLRNVSEQEWTHMWSRLIQVEHHFEYQFPAQPDNAVNMIWRSVTRKLPSLKQSLNKAKRYWRYKRNEM